MGNLLFSADGRISSSEFKKGAIILLALNFFLWPTWFLSPMLGMIATIISLVTIYCWGCLFAKRFHDAGKGGGFYAVVLLLFVLLAGIVSVFATSLKVAAKAQADPELMEKMESMQNIDRNNPDEAEIQAVMEIYAIFGQAGIVPTAISFLVVGGVIAFITNAILKTDPGPNRWG